MPCDASSSNATLLNTSIAEGTEARIVFQLADPAAPTTAKFLQVGDCGCTGAAAAAPQTGGRLDPGGGVKVALAAGFYKACVAFDTEAPVIDGQYVIRVSIGQTRTRLEHVHRLFETLGMHGRAPLAAATED